MSTPFYVRWLQEVPERLDALTARVEAETQRVRTDESLSPQGRYEALAELKASAELEIAATRVRAQEAQVSAERHVAAALRPSTNTGERLLSESQEQRAWDRVRPLLEAGTSAAEIIERAGAAGDVATLRALRAELPAWLETTTVAAAGPMRQPGARDRARLNVEPLLEDIDRAEAPHLPKAQREALETRFQVQALGEVVRAQELLVTSILDGHNVGGALIRAGLATAEAERGLEGSPTGPSDASQLVDAMAARSS